MARRSRRGGRRAQTPEAPLGVGGMAGDLEHGERPVVEGLAQTPDPGAAPGPPPPAAPGGGLMPAGQDLWAPTERPHEPIASPPDMVLGEDPDEFLRAIYQAFPHEDIRILLEGRGI